MLYLFHLTLHISLFFNTIQISESIGRYTSCYTEHWGGGVMSACLKTHCLQRCNISFHFSHQGGLFTLSYFSTKCLSETNLKVDRLNAYISVEAQITQKDRQPDQNHSTFGLNKRFTNTADYLTLKLKKLATCQIHTPHAIHVVMCGHIPLIILVHL